MLKQRRAFVSYLLPTDSHLAATGATEPNQKQEEEDWVLANKVSQCQSLKAAASPDKQTTRGETDSLCKFLGLDLLRLFSSPPPSRLLGGSSGWVGKVFQQL